MRIGNVKLRHRVARVMAGLEPGHTRAEAYAAINDAKILDEWNKPVSASTYYHSLGVAKKMNGKTFMDEHHPGFVPSPPIWEKQATIKLRAHESKTLESPSTRLREIFDKMQAELTTLFEQTREQTRAQTTAEFERRLRDVYAPPAA